MTTKAETLAPPRGHLRLAQFEQARNDIRTRHADAWQKLCSDMQGELDELNRRYWADEEI